MQRMDELTSGGGTVFVGQCRNIYFRHFSGVIKARCRFVGRNVRGPGSQDGRQAKAAVFVQAMCQDPILTEFRKALFAIATQQSGGHLARSLNRCLFRQQPMSDLHDGSVHDEAYRMEMAEKLGTGFVLSCTDCTEKEKEATGAVASK
jgi:hypothetical protein